MIRVNYSGFTIELPDGTVDDMNQVIRQIHQLESVRMVCESPSPKISIESIQEATAGLTTEVRVTPEIIPQALYTVAEEPPRIPNTPIKYDGVQGVEAEDEVNRFKCPSCGQGKLIFVNPHTIIYDINKDMMAVVKHSDEDFDYSKVTYEVVLDLVDPKTYGTQLFADDTACVCPFCHEVHPSKEWVIAYLNMKDFGFKDCINCAKGDMEVTIVAEGNVPMTVKQCPECKFSSDPVGGEINA